MAVFWTSTRGVLAAGLAACALFAGSAHGQRSEGTARQRIRLKGYGMFSYVRPDYGFDKKNLGGTVGADIDGFRFLPHLDLGMDVRYTFSTGNVSNEFYYGGGPRVSLNVTRFRPYADFLFGRGRSTFNHSGDPTYTHDDTGAISYGGGFDYKLDRFWSLRADLQREHWRFSINQPIFYPVAISVGATYQIHFRSRTGPDL